MLRSLYSGVSGLRSNQTKMDVIGNNIANVNTTAFKSGRVKFKDMLSQTQEEGKNGINPKQVGLGTSVASIDTMLQQGALQSTGRDLDFAIEGEGFFMVRDDSGNVRYTRDGSFFVDNGGNLVNAEGFNVLDEDKDPIKATELDEIGIATFTNPQGLKKLGGNTYVDTANSGNISYDTLNSGTGTIRQGVLEMSNVDLANEFTEMIVTSRAFQANSRTITTSDEMLQELINLKR